MSIEIIFALCLWLLITMVTPAKIRLFTSFVAATLIVVLIAFYLMDPKDLVVSVPSHAGQDGYDLPFEQFQSLISSDVDQNVKVLGEAEALAAIPKDILVREDLSEEQLKAVGALPGSEGFLAGKEGIIVRTIPATVEGGIYVPAKHGVEFSPLPLYDALKATESELRKTQSRLQTKENVLNAIRDIVGEEKPNQM